MQVSSDTSSSSSCFDPVGREKFVAFINMYNEAIALMGCANTPTPKSKDAVTNKRLPCNEMYHLFMLLLGLTSQNPVQLGDGLGSLLVQAQVVCRRQQLEANLDGNLHVRHVFAIAVSVPVVKVFDDFVKDHGAVGEPN